MQHFPLIVSGVALNAAAQILLKMGMIQVGAFALDITGVLAAAGRVATSPFILAGLASYVISVAIWLVVLSRVDVSVAYPMVSLGYVFTVVIARFVFQEPVTPLRLLGVLVVCTGIILIARSA
jgi:multidrug transporter EmrE-like cation transporter